VGVCQGFPVEVKLSVCKFVEKIVIIVVRNVEKQEGGRK